MRPTGLRRESGLPAELIVHPIQVSEVSGMGKRDRLKDGEEPSPKKAKKSSKFWKKQLKAIFKSADNSPARLPFKPIRKQLVKAYRKENPSVSKDEAKQICLAEIKKLSSFVLDGNLCRKGQGQQIESAPRETTDAAVTSQSNGGFPNVSVLDTKVYRRNLILL